MGRVDWLLLDVGGVLSTSDDARWPGELQERWARRLGTTRSDLLARLETADLPDATLRSGVEEEFWQQYGDAVGASSDVLAAMRAEFWDAYCATADPLLTAFVRRVHGRVGLAILSNSGDGARREEERRFGFSRWFDPICYSHETGYAKPDPVAYRTALTAMDAEPAQVVFVDDLESNVATAEALGIRGVHHTDAAATVRRLEAFLDDR